MSWLLGAVVGAVFLASGTLKLADPRWRLQAGSLGVPAPVASVVPVIEVVLGALLVAGLARPWPALAAVIVLVVFTAWLASLLRRPVRPVCSCFGNLSRRPVSWRSVARNAALLVVAVLAVALA